MRAISAAQQAVLNAGVQADWTRVSVKDDGGTYRDLTVWPGFNAVVHVDRNEDINSPDATAQVGLKRTFFKLDLSPFMGASALNKGFDPAGAFGAAIFVGRAVKIERAVTPFGRQPSSGDWFNVFEGLVMDFNVAGYGIQLNCRASPSARLSQQYITRERLYSYATVAGVTVPLRIWEANQVYAANEYVLPASRGDADPGKDKFLKIVTPGTSGTTEPIWTTGAGQSDGGCVLNYIGVPASGGYPVQQVMQNLLDDNRGIGDSAVTLYTPTSPSWSIFEFLQQRSFTLDALKTLANQIGWDVRPIWRSGTSQFELTLYAPERDSPTVVHTFAPRDYEELKGLALNILEIRNHWFIWYPDSADLWPDGTPKRKQVEVKDDDSIDKYGDLIAEIQEDQTGLINTSTEANRLANAALSDSAEPTAAISAQLTRAFPWVELNDYYTFSANPAAGFDGDTSLAVTGFKETTEFGTDGKGSVKTSLTCRGKPTIGAKTHIKKTEHPNQKLPAVPHRIVNFQGGKTPTLLFPPTVGGARVLMSVGVDKLSMPEEYEHHVYDVSGTTLSAATLKTISRDRNIEFADLVGGQDYFHRVVPRVRNAGQLVRAQPSSEQAFTAGRAQAGHIEDGIGLGRYPLNGGFETMQPGRLLPDHWEANAPGFIGTNLVVMTDANGIGGGRYMKITSAAILAPAMTSAVFPLVNESETHRKAGLRAVSFWLKNDAGNTTGTFEVQLRLFDKDGAFISLGDDLIVSMTTNLGHWTRYEFLAHVDDTTTVRSAAIDVGPSLATGQIVYLDDISVEYIGSPWYKVGDTSRFTDAYESVPAFGSSGWANVDSDDPDCPRPLCAFRRLPGMKGRLIGRAKSGSVGDVPIFTLPPSFCPPRTRTYVVATDQGPGELEVQSCGDVCLRAGGNGFVELCNVEWEIFEPS